MALVSNLATMDVISETWVDSVKDGLNTGVIAGSYTPTQSGFATGTGGSAANIAYYTFVGGVLTVNGNATFGTTGTTLPGAGGNINVTLPTGFTMLGVNTYQPVGMCNMTIAGTSYLGTCLVQSGTTVRFWATNAAGTYATIVAPTGSIPGTWAAGSSIYYNFSVYCTYA